VKSGKRLQIGAKAVTAENRINSRLERLQGCLQAVFLFSRSVSWCEFPSWHRREIIYADCNIVNSVVAWGQKRKGYRERTYQWRDVHSIPSLLFTDIDARTEPTHD